MTRLGGRQLAALNPSAGNSKKSVKIQIAIKLIAR
jgi:hypothetical protein